MRLSKTPNVEYDKSEFYKKNIKKKVDELVRLCRAERIPMFVTFAVKNTKNSTEYKSDMVLAGARRDLANNTLSRVLKRIALKEKDVSLEFPPHVNKAIKEINAYLNELEQDNGEIIGLADPLITECKDIVVGDMGVNMDKVLNKKNVSDDLDEFPLGD